MPSIQWESALFTSFAGRIPGGTKRAKPHVVYWRSHVFHILDWLSSSLFNSFLNSSLQQTNVYSQFQLGWRGTTCHCFRRHQRIIITYHWAFSKCLLYSRCTMCVTYLIITVILIESTGLTHWACISCPYLEPFIVARRCITSYATTEPFRPQTIAQPHVALGSWCRWEMRNGQKLAVASKSGVSFLKVISEAIQAAHRIRACWNISRYLQGIMYTLWMCSCMQMRRSLSIAGIMKMFYFVSPFLYMLKNKVVLCA